MADEAKVAQEPAEDTFEDFERARQEYLDPSNENRSLSAGVDETADQEEPTELEDLGAETPDDGTSGQETEETPPATETPEPEAKKPVMVLKVDGQKIPIYDYQDAVAFAQKGIHYTQAMQQLAQHRQALMALESHPDLKDELMRRLRGGVPATATNEPEKPKEQEPEFTLPPMNDTETHEEWISRVFKESLPQMIQRKAEQIAAQKAAEAVGAATAGMEESQRRNRIMEAIKADPLRDATIREMRSAIEGGQIPEAIVLAADQDPKTFAFLYDGMRRKAAAAQAIQTQGTTTQRKPAGTTVAAPHTESGGGRSAPRGTGKRSDVDVLEDMKSEDILALAEHVMAGLVR